ncbi:MAG: sigma factor-like helix-turn-helix DNA-binding protein [Eggerthellaceae bacterium]
MPRCPRCAPPSWTSWDAKRPTTLSATATSSPATWLRLARLTPQQRTAVHLFYFEGYATDEIAQITGERSGTVRSHLHRARKAPRSI